MIWIVWIGLIWAFLYVITLILVYYGQEKALIQPGSVDEAPFTAVVVPFRNEAAHLEALISDLKKQDYPPGRVQYIFVDDHSEDGGAELLLEKAREIHLPLQLLHLAEEEQGKKAALRKGIKHSRASLIITLDADTRIPAVWVRNMLRCHVHRKADMVLGPVIMEGSGIFGKLQSAEMIGNMALTAGWAGLGAPVMANGANLLFNRKDYLEYSDQRDDPYISGDDMFLMQYLVQQKKKIVICFKREAAVSTKAAGSLKELLHQRLRWAAKAGGYRLPLIWYNMILVFMVNFLVWVALVLSFFSREAQLALIILLLVKISMEYLVCYPAATVLNLKAIYPYVLLVSLFHLLYIPFFGPVGWFMKYRWKGRQYSGKKHFN